MILVHGEGGDDDDDFWCHHSKKDLLNAEDFVELGVAVTVAVDGDEDDGCALEGDNCNLPGGY